jgi:hypothetical protein
VRAAIAAEGFSSIQAFLDHAAAVYKEHTQRVWAEQKRWRLEDEGRRAAAAPRRLEQNGNAHGLMCHCGNAAAQACSNGCCARCCRAQAGGAVRCARHNT